MHVCIYIININSKYEGGMTPIGTGVSYLCITVRKFAQFQIRVAKFFFCSKIVMNE